MGSAGGLFRARAGGADVMTDNQNSPTNASGRQIPVWTWRDAVRQAAVPPLTKLVCYSIANYLSDVGQGCFPSVRTLMADTGLSNRSISTHLANAVEAGLLVIERRLGRDGRRQLTHYLPRFPDNAVLARTAAAMQEAHADEGDDDDAEIHVSEVHVDETQVSEVHVARPSEPASPGPREPDDASHVNLVQRELSKEISKPPKSPGGGLSENRFEDRLLAQLRATGRHTDAVEHLIAPLVASRKRLALGKGSEAAKVLAEMVGKAHGVPSPALQAAAKRLIDQTSKVKPADLAREIEAAKRAGAMVPIRRGTPQWQAWSRHFRSTKPKEADLMDRFDVWQVRAEWPPAGTSVEAAGRPAA